MQEILERVQKLFNLAEGNSNLNEAAAAYTAAQKLILKHNLNLADLKKQKLLAEEAIIDNTILYTGKRIINWKSYLANGLAKHNSCFCYLSHGKTAEIRVAGHITNVKLVEYFFNSISAQIERLSSIALIDGLGSGKTFTNNFKIGAVSTVLDRLQSSIHEFKKEYGSTALVFVDQRMTEVKTWIEKNKDIKYSTSKSTFRAHSSGLEAGKRAGQEVQLNKALK